MPFVGRLLEPDFGLISYSPGDRHAGTADRDAEFLAIVCVLRS